MKRAPGWPVLFAGLLLAGAASAAPLESIIAAGQLRVGTAGDYRPYALRDPHSNVPLGADVTLARALAAELGVGLQLVDTSWPSLSADAVADRFDIAAGGVSITKARRRIATFSIPYVSDGKTALASCARLEQLDTLRELDRPEVRVIVNPGGTNEAFARARLKRAQLVVHRDNLGVFDELLAGRADAMITDSTEARLYQALHPGALCAAHPQSPFERHDKALMLTGDAALKRVVDDWLRRLQAEDELDANLDRWLAYPWNDAARPMGRLLSLVDARLALMSEVARHKWNAGEPIEDAPREAELLDSLVARAGAFGLPPSRAEAFFRAQIAAARTLQAALFDTWRRQGRKQLPAAPDLRTALRPHLDELSARMLEALAALPPDAVLTQGATLTTRLISAQAERIALAPLRGGT